MSNETGAFIEKARCIKCGGRFARKDGGFPDHGLAMLFVERYPLPRLREMLELIEQMNAGDGSEDEIIELKFQALSDRYSARFMLCYPCFESLGLDELTKQGEPLPTTPDHAAKGLN